MDGPISAVQLQNQLGLGSYRTAWVSCAKLRRAMVTSEPLGGLKADETIIPFRTKRDPVVIPADCSGVGKIVIFAKRQGRGSSPS